MLFKWLVSALAGLAIIALKVHADTPSGAVHAICHLTTHGDDLLALRGCCSCKCDEITCLCPATFVLIPEPCGLGGLGVVMLPLSEADNPSGPVGWVYGKYICHEDRARG